MSKPTLHFGTTCPDCGRGLLFDGDLGGICPVCTHFAPTAAEPFLACVGAELVESADSLDELLGILAEITDEKPSDDVCVWQGQRVVVILFADGTVIDRRAQ